MRTSKSYLFRGAVAKKSAAMACVLAETQEKSEERGSVTEERQEDFKHALIGGCCHGEVGEKLSRKEAS